MIAIVLGTRPEIIKMSPVIRECEEQYIPYYLLPGYFRKLIVTMSFIIASMLDQ